jgi:hypothetical protein
MSAKVATQSVTTLRPFSNFPIVSGQFNVTKNNRNHGRAEGAKTVARPVTVTTIVTQ